jgi:NAD(P)-dependent dehydrogenase (short-subunit alcohol dehydrogenase family)
MTDAFSLAGETAIITGGGTGLGLGIARCFSRAGARVVLVGRRADVLRQSAQELGSGAEWEAHDILKLDDAESLMKRVWERVGPNHSGRQCGYSRQKNRRLTDQ